MKRASLDALTHLNSEERKEALESLGVDFLIDVFAGKELLEDFETKSKRGAELVRKAVDLEFKKRFGNYPYKVTLIVKDRIFKVAFFK